MTGFNVIHDQGKEVFYILLSGEKAILQYSYSAQDNVYDLYHTEVPEHLRGKGIAKHLAKAALDFVVNQKARAILSCTYLQKYHRENPSLASENVVV